MLTVGDLLAMLSRLPPSTKVLTAGLEGIYPAEFGNLLPLKVLSTRFGIFVYIDDGAGSHRDISDNWVPLDVFVRYPS